MLLSMQLDSVIIVLTFQSLNLGFFQTQYKGHVENVGINNQDIGVLFHINSCGDMSNLVLSLSISIV